MTRDLRKYDRQTNIRLIIGGIALLFLVGGGLIYWRYGLVGTALGLLCIGGGLLPVGIIQLIFWIMDAIIKNARSKQ